MENIEILKFEKGFKEISKIYTSPFGKINPKTNEWTFKDLKEYDDKTNLMKPADTKKFKFIAKWRCTGKSSQGKKFDNA